MISLIMINLRDNSQESERDASPVAATSSAQESLSIEETNKLRAKLGLKPLEVAEKAAGESYMCCIYLQLDLFKCYSVLVLILKSLNISYTYLFYAYTCDANWKYGQHEIVKRVLRLCL